tara:strand:+ start:1175 stop:1339 length:165 start_codon:yes stop_codon:yes gene_type:complete
MKNIIDLDLGPDLIKLNIIKNEGFTEDFTYKKEINIFQYVCDQLKLIRNIFLTR